MFTKHRGSIAPFDRFGMEIALSKIVHDPILQILCIHEVPWRENLALKRREDDLDLIQPGGIDWQPVDADLEGQLQRPNPATDLLGRMGGAIVQDQMQNSDALGPKALEDHLEERLEFHESFSPQATGHRLAGVDQQPGEQIQHALAHVTSSVAHRFSRTGRIDPAGSGQGLDTGLLIRADEDLSPSGKGSRPLVKIQHHRGLLEELRVRRLLPGVALPGFDPLLPKPFPDGGGGNA